MSKKTTTRKINKEAAPLQKSKPKAVKKTPVDLDTAIFPIGKLKYPEEYSETVINKLIQDIRVLPEHLKSVSKKINKKKKLQYSYREGGWTIEQIIHHLADSHMNALIRFKLALTENNPTIKPYDLDLWVETADAELPIKVSVRLLKSIPAKWVALLENMDKNDWKRTFYHPEYNRTSTLEQTLALYAWHGKHHVAQIEVALRNN